MQIDLRGKAQKLVYDTTIKYKALQDQAFNDAENDLKRIYREFNDKEAAQKILMTAVEKKLAGIIDKANNGLSQLDSDISLLNKNINILTESGQNFIESHLEKFHMLELASEVEKKIEDKST
jgi:hypothetical protein